MKPFHIEPLEGETFEQFQDRYCDALLKRWDEAYRRKQASDRRTDRRRRTLAGARLPRSVVENYKAAAQGKGLSFYRWVAEALEERYRGGW